MVDHGRHQPCTCPRPAPCRRRAVLPEAACREGAGRMQHFRVLSVGILPEEQWGYAQQRRCGSAP